MPLFDPKEHEPTLKANYIYINEISDIEVQSNQRLSPMLSIIWIDSGPTFRILHKFIRAIAQLDVPHASRDYQMRVENEGWSHYIDENKRPVLEGPTIFKKINLVST